DIGWRAHPDYRGEQSLNIIASAAFVGIDHPGRAYLALAVFFRHVGLIDEELSPRLRELASTRVLDRARVLGAVLRVAYLVSASTTGVLPRTPMTVERGRLVLRFENGFKALAGERVFVRLRQLARLIGREPVMETADAPMLRASGPSCPARRSSPARASRLDGPGRRGDIRRRQNNARQPAGVRQSRRNRDEAQ